MNNPGPFDGVTNAAARAKIQEHVNRAESTRRSREPARPRFIVGTPIAVHGVTPEAIAAFVRAAFSSESGSVVYSTKLSP